MAPQNFCAVGLTLDPDEILFRSFISCVLPFLCCEEAWTSLTSLCLAATLDALDPLGSTDFAQVSY